MSSNLGSVQTTSTRTPASVTAPSHFLAKSVKTLKSGTLTLVSAPAKIKLTLFANGLSLSVMKIVSAPALHGLKALAQARPYEVPIANASAQLKHQLVKSAQETLDGTLRSTCAAVSAH